ncbi:MAG: hypothetical protein ACI8QS_002107 [Planctomycetota bacterium]|jgi:hypothetical protein
MFGVLAWTLRDGLGPDSVDSSGWQAIVRLFWTFYWGPILILLSLAAVLCSKYAREPVNQGEDSP